VKWIKEGKAMCDYSLQGIRNRLAQEGERLVVHRFYTWSKGLTSPDYLDIGPKPKGLMAIFKNMFGGQPKECAVCIPDGAILRMQGIPPKVQETHRLSSTEVVTFRQLSAEVNTYRDAVEFKNGAKVRLQELEQGQSVEVLALSSERVRSQEQSIIPVW
jgi:hypothetical protein